MSETEEKYAKERIYNFVWSGFYMADDIIRIIFEDTCGREVDRSWIAAAVQSEMTRKSAAEVDWPTQTDCDRLDVAFDQLNKNGILALQNAGYTQSDGLSDIRELDHQMGGPKSGVIGYCFYHGQDVEHALKGRGIMLTFGDITGDNEKGVAVGRRICETLTAAGLSVAWNEWIESRIEIPKIEWQRRNARR